MARSRKPAGSTRRSLPMEERMAKILLREKNVDKILRVGLNQKFKIIKLPSGKITARRIK